VPHFSHDLRQYCDGTPKPHMPPVLSKIRPFPLHLAGPHRQMQFTL
jgi:hypothetical protein